MEPEPAPTLVRYLSMALRSALRVFVVGAGGVLALLFIGGLAFVFVFRGSRNAPTGERDQVPKLGEIRSALAVYHGEHEGAFPERFDALLEDGRFLSRVPTLWSVDNDHFFVHRPLVPHDDTTGVAEYAEKTSRDSGKWGYVANKASPDWGHVFIDCTHQDSRGEPFSSY